MFLITELPLIVGKNLGERSEPFIQCYTQLRSNCFLFFTRINEGTSCKVFRK